MSGAIVECVPNFSEGRDRAKVARIAAAIQSAPGVAVLDQTLDADHNRSVITFAGGPEAIAEGALRGVASAVAEIDLNQHQGVHPRVGAADVVPFVPIAGVTLAECAVIAARAGEQVWRRLGVPVFLYGASATRPERAALENVRREVRTQPDRHPDFGEGALHPTAGATVVGARNILIAFNVNLDTADVAIARAIARKVRFSSGGLPHVKALGLLLRSRGIAQVSMNLTDFEQTPVHLVFQAVREEATRLGVKVRSSEIVGLIPRKALEMAEGCDLRIENFRPELILEDRLKAFGLL
ncbi:MAG: glutamate formimidoyltransferase [Candidatus Solibacter usitatus]|nr:glutamate formimidoyltransferase [Candidatus Solibacter usitatus]